MAAPYHGQLTGIMPGCGVGVVGAARPPLDPIRKDTVPRRPGEATAERQLNFFHRSRALREARMALLGGKLAPFMTRGGSPDSSCPEFESHGSPAPGTPD